MDVQKQHEFIKLKLGLVEQDLTKYQNQYYTELYKDADIASMHQQAENEYFEQCQKRLDEQLQYYQHHEFSDAEKRYISQNLQIQPNRQLNYDDRCKVLDQLKSIKKQIVQTINICDNTIQNSELQLQFKQNLDQKFQKIKQNKYKKDIEYPQAMKQFNEKHQQHEKVDVKLEAVKIKNKAKNQLNLSQVSKKADQCTEDLTQFFGQRSIRNSKSFTQTESQSSSRISSVLEKKQQLTEEQDQQWNEKRQEYLNQIKQIQTIRSDSQNITQKSLKEINAKMLEIARNNYNLGIKAINNQENKIQQNLKKAKQQDHLTNQKRAIESFKLNSINAQTKYKQMVDQDISKMNNKFSEQLKESVPADIIERQKRYRKLDYAAKFYQKTEK